MSKIKFECYGPNDIIMAEDRKDAIKMIKSDRLSKYNTVVVALENGERFHLYSPRGMEYFGIGGRQK